MLWPEGFATSPAVDHAPLHLPASAGFDVNTLLHHPPFHVPRSMRKTVPSAFIDQTFMIISGVSAKKEQCLVVEGGKVDEIGSGLNIVACDDAVKFDDGRELFNLQADGQLVTSIGRKCVALAHKEDADPEQRELQLTDCDAVGGDFDRISWKVSPQNQLMASPLPHSESRLPSDFCMSLDGQGLPGLKNVAEGATTHASSSADQEAHIATRATDGLRATYWASQVDPEEPVTLQVNLGANAVPLRGIEIKWECPPKHWRLETSEDGVHWLNVFSKEPDLAAAVPKKKGMKKVTDQLEITKVPLDGVHASAARIVMDVPAPRCATAKGERLFGVREFSVKVAKRSPWLAPCDAKGGDGRSKWFLTQVGQWQPCRKLPNYRETFL